MRNVPRPDYSIPHYFRNAFYGKPKENNSEPAVRIHSELLLIKQSHKNRRLDFCALHSPTQVIPILDFVKFQGEILVEGDVASPESGGPLPNDEMDITRDLQEEINPHSRRFFARRSRPWYRGGARNVAPPRAIGEQVSRLPSTIDRESRLTRTIFPASR